MARILSFINLSKFFIVNSPYNSSYTKIGDLIEKGDVKKLEEIGKSRYRRKRPIKLKIQSVGEKENKAA